MTEGKEYQKSHQTNFKKGQTSSHHDIAAASLNFAHVTFSGKEAVKQTSLQRRLSYEAPRPIPASQKQQEKNVKSMDVMNEDTPSNTTDNRLLKSTSDAVNVRKASTKSSLNGAKMPIVKKQNSKKLVDSIASSTASLSAGNNKIHGSQTLKDNVNSSSSPNLIKSKELVSSGSKSKVSMSETRKSVNALNSKNKSTGSKLNIASSTSKSSKTGSKSSVSSVENLKLKSSTVNKKNQWNSSSKSTVLKSEYIPMEPLKYSTEQRKQSKKVGSEDMTLSIPISEVSEAKEHSVPSSPTRQEPKTQTIDQTEPRTESRQRETSKRLFEKRPKEIKLTKYQKMICDAAEITSGTDQLNEDPSPQFYQYYCAGLERAIDLKLFKKVSQSLLYEYILFNANFHFNKKVIDADIDCKIDQVPLDAHVEEVPIFGDTSSHSLSDRVQSIVQSWMMQRKKFDKLFQILVISPLSSETQDDYRSIVIGIANKALLDMSSLGLFIHEALSMYVEIDEMLSKGAVFQAEDYLSNRPAMEIRDAFITMANTILPSIEYSKDLHVDRFWRQIYIELTQDSVEDYQRMSLEERDHEINVRLEKLKRELLQFSTQKKKLEESLQTSRQKRLELEKYQDGVTTSFIDPTTGQSMLITSEARHIFLKVFIQSENSEIDFKEILIKYDVSEPTIKEVLRICPTFESFLESTEPILAPVSKSSKDLRRLVTAGEMCRNYILEAQHEHGKVKFGLERQIAKFIRELEHCSTKIKSHGRLIHKIGEESLTIQNTLNPPIVENRIDPINLDDVALEDKDTNTTNQNTFYKFVAFTIPTSTMERLKVFHSNMFTTKDGLVQTLTNETNLTTDKILELGHFAMYLAAAAILLKHITGSSKFLLGIFTNLRNAKMKFGPLSPIMPIKLDFTDPRKSLESITKSIFHDLCWVHHHAWNFPYETFKGEYSPEHFPILFEYLSRDCAKPFVDSSNTEFGLISHAQSSELEHLKISVHESGDGTKCVLQYRHDVVSEAHVEKWADKFMSILESIDFNQRRMSIPSFVTRFYNPIWQSRSVMDLKKGSIGSCLALFDK